MLTTVGRLHVEAAVGPAVVVADVFFQDVLGMTLSPNDDVVEAVLADRADHPFGERVGLRTCLWSSTLHERMPVSYAWPQTGARRAIVVPPLSDHRFRRDFAHATVANTFVRNVVVRSTAQAACVAVGKFLLGR